LKEELQAVTSRTDDLKMLVGGMRAGSDEEATTLLARLRLGDSLEDLAHTARTVLGRIEIERPSPGHEPESISNPGKDEKRPQENVGEMQIEFEEKWQGRAMEQSWY
jgi:hypothetical protein